MHAIPPHLEHKSGYEFVNGQVLERHLCLGAAHAAACITATLAAAAHASGTATVFGGSLGYKCYPRDPSMIRKPHLSLVRTERLSHVNPRDACLSFPADVVVEIINPADPANDFAEKVQEYLAHGFPLVWIVDPQIRTITAHRNDGSMTVLREANPITLESLLPDFACKVAELIPAWG